MIEKNSIPAETAAELSAEEIASVSGGTGTIGPSGGRDGGGTIGSGT